MNRIDGRSNYELRSVNITPGIQTFAEGSALIEIGLTKVICAATIEERVPFFLRGEGKGWITAEYSLLPRSTLIRSSRDIGTERQRGRSQEIQRMIGRSLRSVTDLFGLGERTIILDCDVLQADGGTRSAALTGAYVALYQALQGLVKHRILSKSPLKSAVAGISVGLVDGEQLLDLCYEEDVRAQVDLNVAMTENGDLVEIQGSAEKDPFPQQILADFIPLAQKGLNYLFDVQLSSLQSLKYDTFPS